MNSPENSPNQLDNLRLLDPNDKRLHTAAEAIPPEEITSPQIQAIIDKMLEISSGSRDVGIGNVYMVGLAATQLGIMRRIILVDTDMASGQVPKDQTVVRTPTVFINPEIVEASDEMVWEREGCFSFEVQKGVFGALPRSKKIKVRAYDRNGEIHEYVGEDFVARIFLHEIDHLDGIEYFERLPEGHKLHLVTTPETEAYRTGGWKDWHRTIEPEDVLAGKIEESLSKEE